MDISKLVRDAKKIHAVLETKGDIIKAKKRIKVYIPTRFKEKKLAVVGNEVSIVGVYAMVVDDKYYGVSKTNAMMSISPSEVNTVMVGEESYYEFVFENGDTFCSNKNLVHRGTLPYDIFDEIVAKGNTPWYLNLTDLAELFDTAKLHAGFSHGTNQAILEMITASRARLPNDRAKYYRHALTQQKDFENKPYYVIPLRSVQYGATNTVAKLIGAYFDEGLTSALVNPSERSEQIEEILRM